METVALVAVLAAAGATAYSQVEAGKAADANAKQQEKWHQYNAMISERDAKTAEKKASLEARAANNQAKAINAKNIAALAENGSFGGSALDMLAYTAGQLETDVQSVFAAGQTAADKFKSAAAIERIKGQNALIRGKNLKKASYFNAGTTILTGLGSAGLYAYGAGMFAKTPAIKNPNVTTSGLRILS